MKKDNIILHSYFLRMSLVCIFFLTGIGLYAQTTVNLSASADAFIDQNVPTTNFGSSSYIQSFPYTLSPGYTKRSLIKFDLSSIPAGATITSATLYLYNFGTRGLARTVALHKATSSWSEGSVTWNSFNGAFSGTASATCALTYPYGVNGVWDLKTDVQSMVNGSTTNYGWLMKDNAEDASQDFWQFNSREHASTNLRPVLTVVYTSALNVTVSPSSSTICSGGSVSLTASGGTTYSWSPSTGLSATTGATVTANPTTTTTYTVTGTTGSNTGTKTVTVTVNSNPTVSISPSTATICNGGNIQLTASGASTYVWSPTTNLTSSTVANPTASPSSTTTYTVTGTASNGCTATATRQVTVNSKPTATISNTQKPTSTSSCDGHATVTPSGGSTPYAYSWSGPNNYTSTQQSPTNLCGGNYNVIVTDANGCSVTKNDTIVTCNAIAYTVQKSQPCYGANNGSISLVGFSGNNGGNTGGSLVCPGTLYTCSEGDLLTNVGTSIVVNPGEVKRFWGSFNGTITINGGTLITCGSVWATSLNITNGGSLIANGSLTVNAPVTIPAACRIVNNNGSVAFYHPVTADGMLFNLYGSMTLYSTLINNGNKVYNNSSMSVNGSTFSDNYDESQLTACANGGNNSTNNNNSNNTCSITWTGTSQTGAVLTNLSAGTYIATITCGGCVKLDTVVLTQPSAALNLNLISTTASSTSCDGKINVSTSGGTPSYTYEVDHVIATPEFTALCAGSHFVKVTDSKGCIDTAFYIVDTLAPSCCIGMVSVSKNNTSCGLSNGSLTLDLGQDTCSADTTTGGGNGGVLLGQNCIDLAVVPNQNCSSGCTRELSTSNNTVNTGEKICISGAYVGDVVMNGGTLVICGSAAINNLTFNSGEIYFNTSVTVAHVLNGTGSGARNIWAHGSVWFMDGSYEGGVQNYNSVRIEDNYTVKAGQSTYSQGDFYVVGNMINNGTVVNHAGINTNGLRIDGNLTNNGTLSNYCNLVVGGIYLENGVRNDHNSAYVSSGSGSGNGGNNQASCTVVWKTLSGTNLSTASTLNNLAPGTYVAEITCVGGCTRKDTLVISGSNSITFDDTITSATSSNCNAQIDLLNVSGGNGVYTYYIDGSSASLPFTGLCAGDHIVKVVDSSGCEKIDTLTIASEHSCEGFDVFLSAHSPTCLSTSNGAVTVSIDFGTAPFTYQWNNGATTKDIDGITAGFYTVVITDSMGCEITKSKAVDPGSPCDNNFCANAPQIVISSSNLNVCSQQGCLGEIAFDVTGGQGAVNYYWQAAPSSNSSFSGLCNGNYQFKVVDSLGCYSALNFTIIDNCSIDTTVNDMCGFSLNSTSTEALCDGPSNGFVELVGDVTALNFNWINYPNEHSNRLDNLTSGVYQVLVSKDTCVQLYTFTIDTLSPLTIVPAITHTAQGSCNGIIDAQITGGSGNLTVYLNNVLVNLPIDSVCAGNCILKVADSLGCEASIAIKVEGVDTNAIACGNIALNRTVTPSECPNKANGQIQITGITGGNAPYTYTFQGQPTQDISFSELAADEYVFVVTDKRACVQTFTVDITTASSLCDSACTSKPVLSVSDSNYQTCNTSCDGSVVFNVSGGFGELRQYWQGSLTNQTQFLALCSGSYKYKVIDSEQCLAEYAFSISNECANNLCASKNISVEDTAIDASCAAKANGSFSVIVHNATAPLRYEWSTGVKVISNDSSASISGLIPNHSYSVTITDADGCAITTSEIVNGEGSCVTDCDYSFDLDIHKTSASSSQQCNGSILVDVSTVPTQSGEVFAYRFDGVASVAPYKNGLCAGSYTFTVINTSDYCYKEEIIPIGTESLNDTLCNSFNFSITESSEGSCSGAGYAHLAIQGGLAPYTIYVNGVEEQKTSANTTVLTNLVPGDHLLKIKDAKGCVRENILTINDPGGIPLVINLNNITSESCTGGGNDGSVSVWVSGGQGTKSITWNDANTTSGAILSAVSAGTYTVTVSDTNSCVVTKTFTINGGALGISATYESTPVSGADVCDGFAKVIPQGGSNNISYAWSHNGSVATSFAKNLCTGYYTVQLTDNTSGCATELSFFLPVDSKCGINLLADKGNVSCAGNDGFVHLELYTPSESSTQCYTGSREPQVACNTACDEYLSGNVNHTSNGDNKRYCVAKGAVVTGSINITGGELLVCGELSGVTLNLGDSTTVYNNGKINISTFSSLGSGIEINNYGSFAANTLNVPVEFNNYGLLYCASATALATNATILNRGELRTDGALTLNGNLNNEAAMQTSGLILNSGGNYTNLCSAHINGAFTAGDDFTNKGYIETSGLFTLGSALKASLYDGSYFKAGSLQLNGATINGAGTVPSGFKILGSVSTTSGSVVNGKLNVCNLEAGANLTLGADVHVLSSCSAPITPCIVTWDDNATTAFHRDNLPAGTYSGSIQCGGGCSKAFSYTILPYSPLVVSTSGTSVLCSSASAGSINLSVSGGVAPYTYDWSGNGVDVHAQNQSALSAGTYTVTVSDAKGCSAAQKSFTITSSPSLEITTDSKKTCEGLSFGTVSAQVSGGTGANTYSYQWKNSANQVVGTTPSVNGLAEGNYTLYVSDQQGCTASETESVDVDNTKVCQQGCDGFTAKGEGSPESCPGAGNGVAYIQVSGSNDYTIEWGANGPNKFAAGTYSVTVIDNQNSCPAIDVDFTIPVSTAACPFKCNLTSSMTGGAVSCIGEEDSGVEINITSNDAIKAKVYRHGQTTAIDSRVLSSGGNYTLNSLGAGRYYVVVMSSIDSSCNSMSEAAITQPTKLKVYTSTTAICPGETSVISSSYATGNLWYKNEQLVGEERTLTVSEAGTYVLKISGDACEQQAQSVVSEKVECKEKPPLCSIDTLPSITVSDPCVASMVSAALHHAKYEYETYREQLRESFKKQYVDKCLASNESLMMEFNDREHHYTLYYYDQAKNLTRTVSPKGVKLINEANYPGVSAQMLVQVKEDRKNGEQTIFTDHSYYTDYKYNSLNQLTGQLLPDHDAMDIYSSDATKYKGGLPSGLNITGVEFQENGNGFLTSIDAAGDGHIYRTFDGGKTWTIQTSLGIRDLRHVQIVNSTVAYAAGDKGLFAKSIDGGETWVAIPVGTLGDIRGLHFVDATHGRLVTERGKILKTDDGGESWQIEVESIMAEASVNANAEVSSVNYSTNGTEAYFAVNYNGTGYVIQYNAGTYTEVLDKNFHLRSTLIGLAYANNNVVYSTSSWGELIKSTDGGNSWTLVGTVSSTYIQDIYFRSEEQGVASLGQQLHRTYDGGLTWEAIPLAANLYSRYPINIDKADNKGYLLTETKLYNTINGGMSSTLVNVPSLGSAKLSAVGFSLNNKQEVLLSVENGKFYRSIDGGKNWILVTTSFTGGYGTQILIHNQVAVVLSIGGSIYYSTDWKTAATITWNQVAGTTNYAKLVQTPNALYALNANGSDNGKIMYTTNDIGVWTEFTEKAPLSGSGTSGNFAISPLGTSVLLTTESGGIYKSVDLGEQAWETKTTEVHAPELKGISKNPFTGGSYTPRILAVGKRGTSLFTTNTATGWVISAPATSSFTVQDYNNVFSFPNSAGMFVSGAEGAVRIGDGTSLSALGNSNTSNLFAADMVSSSNDIYAVGEKGTILRSVSFGSFAKENINISSSLYDVAAFSSNYILAVGTGGQIVKYNGSAWSAVTNMEALALNATDMIGASGTGYGVGKNGMIAKTEDAGYTWTKIDTKKTQSLFGVAFKDNVNGVAVGDNGTIMRTVNGGLDYFKAAVNKPSGLTANLKAVQWVNDKLGFIAGAGGVVLKTVDGGANWTAESTGSTADFTSVYFPDKQVGYAVGSNKAIYKAEMNIGTGVYAWSATPELDPAASAFTINSVYFVDREIGYVSGSGGRLYKTINGGDSWVKDVNVGASAGSNSIGKIIPVDRTNFFVAGAGTTLTHVNDEKDQYSVKLWYDELGRVVLKQDARQFPTKSYSYSVYDEFNRIIEAGEVSNITSVSSYANTSVRSQVLYSSFLSWLNTSASQKKQVSFTAYDKALKVFAGSTQNSFVQENLRPRVSSTYYIENNFSGAARTKVLAGGYDFASHYSYDEHGNVKTLISENKQLEGLNESLKRVDYNYDLVSGNVLEVVYQEGRKDQFMHKYSYDADNRIVNALTSKDGVVWETDAHYEYYRHSVLKRTEIGESKVQGLDYFYTIHGWLKGVNSETLKSNRDLGKDGSTESTEVKDWSAKDVYGFSLKYYEGDYKSIGTIAQNDNALAKEEALYASTNNLYNGNIGAMVTSISKFDNGAPQAMAYGYDQLNRIVSAKAYGHTGIATGNDWLGLNEKAAYHETYSYDANGNILSLTRTDGAGDAMDNFTYKYAVVDPGTPTAFKKNSNRLMAVEDAVTGNAAKKIGDIQAGQVYDAQNVANNNYQYDGIGNLVKDAQEEISSIKWHVNGKVTSVSRTTGSTKPDLEFQYDAMGNRTVKIVKPRTINGASDESKWEYSYYVRDASGNVMAIYNKKYTSVGNSGYKETYTLLEQDIYGSSRLGTYTPVDNVIASRNIYGTIDATSKKINISSTNSFVNTSRDTVNIVFYTGHKSYELSNHLGNVLAVVSDRIIPVSSNATTVEEFDADVVSASDYTPFGMAMDKRKYSTPSYRYAFNGMEKETDISEGDYTTSYRLLDSRLGRWFSIDPRFDKFSWQSPYVSMDNNPIYLKDPLGDSTFVSKLSEGKYKVIGGSLKGDDNGIYVKDANGKIGELLGYTATPMSFYNADANKWMGTITTGDQGGKNFLNKLLAENPDLVTYCSNATGGKKYDFKRTNGTTTTYYNTDETYYRGMPILGTVNGKQIYASARDVGNIGAGIVAGRNGLGWENGRIGFDALESYQQKVFTSESKSTQYAEKLGHNIGSAMYQKMELGRLPGNGHLMHIKIPNTFIKKGSL